jgi:phage host-nuclease inhibitor protein Gam
MPTRPEALRLADLLESCPLAVGDAQQAVAAAELRRLHAERAAADGVINDLVAKVRELQKENTSLSAALASSCDEQRHELWESGGIAGCERARVAERQRDVLLAEHQQTLALQQRSYEREIRLEVEAEREACAALLEANGMRCGEESLSRLILETNAAAIRARTP